MMAHFPGAYESSSLVPDVPADWLVHPSTIKLILYKSEFLESIGR